MQQFFKRILILLFSGLPFLCLGQVTEQNPPLQVKVSLNARYPGAKNVHWNAGHDSYDAHFKQEKLATTARYTTSGQWLSTRTELQEKDWPQLTIQYLNDQFPDGYTYTSGYKIEEPEGTRMELRLNDGKQERFFRFDSEGRIIGEGKQ